jgi:hypothetical protein
MGYGFRQHFAYITDLVDSSGSILHVVDISDTLNVKKVAEFKKNGYYLYDIVVDGDRAYIDTMDSNTYETGVLIVDLSNPPMITELALIPIWSNYKGFITAADGIMITRSDSFNKIDIVDVTNPISPIFAGSYEISDSNWLLSTAVIKDNYLYLIGSKGGTIGHTYNELIILDITDPANSKEIIRYGFGGMGESMKIVDNEIYITGADGGLYIFGSPDSTLEMNHYSGIADSYFSVNGKNFPPISSASIQINSVLIGSVQTDSSGSLEFLLDSSVADTGYYNITVTSGQTALTRFVLTEDGDLWPQEGSGEVFSIPAGISASVMFLPIIQHN